MNTIVTFNEVIKRYDSTLALDKLTFKVSKNECVAMVGNNGCGKTSIINVLGNLIGYDEGEVRYNGKKIVPNSYSYKEEIGMLLSKPYYINEFTIIQYWKFLGNFFKINSNELMVRINSLLIALNLEDKKNTKILQLSSGSQIRVSLGGSLIHNPKLLLLDEPFVHLDIKSIDKVSSIINNLKNSKTILITSHNLDLVIELCDTFLIIDKGKIVKEIFKADFSNKSDLKRGVMKYFVSEKSNLDLSWLNG